MPLQGHSQSATAHVTHMPLFFTLSLSSASSTSPSFFSASFISISSFYYSYSVNVVLLLPLLLLPLSNLLIILLFSFWSLLMRKDNNKCFHVPWWYPHFSKAALAQTLNPNMPFMIHFKKFENWKWEQQYPRDRNKWLQSTKSIHPASGETSD